MKKYLIETACWEYIIRTESNIDMLNYNIKRRLEIVFDEEDLWELVKLPFQRRSEKIKRILNWEI